MSVVFYISKFCVAPWMGAKNCDELAYVCPLT